MNKRLLFTFLSASVGGILLGGFLWYQKKHSPHGDDKKHGPKKRTKNISKNGQAIKEYILEYMTKVKVKFWENKSMAEIRSFKNIFTSLDIEVDNYGKYSVDHYRKLINKKNADQRILIQGIGGTGKTTLCKKICFDWAHGQLPEFDYIIPIQMRYLTDQYSSFNEYISDITGGEFQSINDIEIKSEKFNILLLFDGLDEYSGFINEHLKAPFRKIINGVILPHTSIVFFTRPWIFAQDNRENKVIRNLYRICKFRCWIKGFNPTQQIDFVHLYFKNLIMNIPSPAETLLEIIVSDKQLVSNAANPLLLTYFCLIFEEFQRIPKHKTLLYKDVVEVIGKRYIRKFKQKSYEEYLELLGRIAFVGVLNRSTLREEDSLLLGTQINEEQINFFQAKELTNDYFNSALVTIIERPSSAKYGTRKVAVEFYHKSIQDYLAIWWVFKHFNEKIIVDAIKESRVRGVPKSLEDESSEHVTFFLSNFKQIFPSQYLSFAGINAVFDLPVHDKIYECLWKHTVDLHFLQPEALHALKCAMSDYWNNEEFILYENY